VSVSNLVEEITAWLEPIAGGWRFLFSPTFRAQTREAWRHEHTGYVFWDVFWGVLGILVSLATACFLVALTWPALGG
jgi:hypothetical protein